MLGELIGRSSGKTGGFRVITTGDGRTALEVTLRGQGELMGQPIEDFGTLVQPVEAGKLQGDAHHVMMTAAGDIGDWRGSGVGRQIGPGFKSSWGAYGRFTAPRGNLAPLDSIVTAIEFDVEEDGSYRWRMWEWSGAAVASGAGV